jgi:hypothetical protein
VIGSLIGVACAAGVMYVGVGQYPWSDIVWACALVALLPVGVLPVAAWLGIVFPTIRAPCVGDGSPLSLAYAPCG